VAKIENSRAFAGKSTDQLYSGFEAAYGKAGFKVWKSRPIAWLALAKKTDPAGEIQSTLSARLGNPASVTLVMMSEAHDEAYLRSLAEQIWQALQERN
jgi:hypothetical protein